MTCLSAPRITIRFPGAVIGCSGLCLKVLRDLTAMFRLAFTADVTALVLSLSRCAMAARLDLVMLFSGRAVVVTSGLVTVLSGCPMVIT